jgi:hypothetical protein
MMDDLLLDGTRKHTVFLMNSLRMHLDQGYSEDSPRVLKILGDLAECHVMLKLMYS